MTKQMPFSDRKEYMVSLIIIELYLGQAVQLGTTFSSLPCGQMLLCDQWNVSRSDMGSF